MNLFHAKEERDLQYIQLIKNVEVPADENRLYNISLYEQYLTSCGVIKKMTQFMEGPFQDF